jgi:hypothetical protein
MFGWYTIRNEFQPLLVIIGLASAPEIVPQPAHPAIGPLAQYSHYRCQGRIQVTEFDDKSLGSIDSSGQIAEPLVST